MAAMKTTTIQIPPRYEAIEEIGRGAQAVMYRVECEGATRALKAARRHLPLLVYNGLIDRRGPAFTLAE